MTMYMGLDLGQRQDYSALSVIRQREEEVLLPYAEAERLGAVGSGSGSRMDGAAAAHALFVGFAASETETEQERQQRENEEWKRERVAERLRADPEPRYRARVPRYEGVHLERFELGTSYPAIVRHVINLVRRPELATSCAALVLDATGVGGAVLDLFREAPDLPVPVVAITITGGDAVRFEREERTNGENYWVPKRELVGVLQVLMPPPVDEHDYTTVPPEQPRLLMSADLPLTSLFLAEAHNFKAKISAKGHDSYEAGSASEWREGAHDDVVLAVSLPCWYAVQAAAARSAAGDDALAAAPPLLLTGNGMRAWDPANPTNSPNRRGALRRQIEAEEAQRIEDEDAREHGGESIW